MLLEGSARSVRGSPIRGSRPLPGPTLALGTSRGLAPQITSSTAWSLGEFCARADQYPDRAGCLAIRGSEDSPERVGTTTKKSPAHIRTGYKARGTPLVLRVALSWRSRPDASSRPSQERLQPSLASKW